MKMLYACQLHQFAIDLKVQRVVAMLEKQLDVLDCDNQSAVFLLEVAYTEMEHDKRLRKQIRKKGIVHITENMHKIDFTPVESMPGVIGTDIVIAIQKAIQGTWEMVGTAIKEGMKASPISSNFPGSKKFIEPSDKSEIDPSEPVEVRRARSAKKKPTANAVSPASKAAEPKATKKD